MKKLLAIAVLASILAPAAQAQIPPPPPPPRSITVDGQAQAQVPPDQAILSMTLTTRDIELKAAKRQNDEMVEKLVTIARQFNIPKDKILTSGVSIAPEYNYDNKTSEQRFVGYIVSRSFRVTMDNLDLPERVLSAIVDAKIDQVNGIDFRLADPEGQLAALRVKAFENARTQAEALAKAAGSKLGPVLDLSTIPFEPVMTPHIMPMQKMAEAEAASVAPSLPGLIELHALVAVTFALE